MANTEVQTTSSKLNSLMEKNRKSFITIAVVIIVALIAFIVTSAVLDNVKNKNIEAIDVISYELTNESTGLAESEINARCDAALDKLAAYTSKGGIVGARANMLAADITYMNGKYAESAEYWKAVAVKGKKTYLEPIAQFNVGVCSEELGNKEAAAEAYKAAADNKDFVQKAHAKFSYGRVLESLGKYSEAVEVYKDLNDKLPDDTWAKLAKSRILDLEISGKVN